MKIKGAIFDMDGTLLDSMYIWDDCTPRYLQRMGVAGQGDINQKLETMSFYEGVEYLRQNCLPHMTSREIEAGIYEIINDEYINKAQLKPYALETLRQMSGMGIKTAVATANDLELARAALERCGAMEYIDCIITCRMAGAGKEQPDVFFMAAEALGLKGGTAVVFEDAPHAIMTAKKAGFPVAAVSDGHWRRQRRDIIKQADWFLEDLGQWRVILDD